MCSSGSSSSAGTVVQRHRTSSSGDEDVSPCWSVARALPAQRTPPTLGAPHPRSTCAHGGPMRSMALAPRLGLRMAAVLPLLLLLLLSHLCTAQTPPSSPESPAPVRLVVARRTPLGDAQMRLEQQLDRAQAERFTALHPHITVHFEDFPASSSVALRLMTEQLWRPASSSIDVYSLDAPWIGDVAPYFTDLRAWVPANLTERFRPQLVDQNRRAAEGGKLVALPQTSNYGVLLYRRDLLAKYNYSAPPRTYEEMERMALHIVAAEAAAGGSAAEQLVGYTFQGDSYEGLSCNALEWIYAAGGGSILESDGDSSSGAVGSASALRITINNPHTIRVLERARTWVSGGGISPRSVMAYGEDESFRQFSRGRAVFSRQWIQSLAQLRSSAVEGLYGVTYLPGDEAAVSRAGADGLAALVAGGGGGATVGGSSLGVAEASLHKEAAALYIDFATSPAEQQLSASMRSYPPVLAAEWVNSSSLCDAVAFGPNQCDVASPHLVERPWTLAAPLYNTFSSTLYRAVSEMLAGGGGPIPERVAALECDLASIVGVHVERCAAHERAASIVKRKESTVMALLALSGIAAALIVLVVGPFLLRFRKNRVIHHSSLSFCLICLSGLLLIVLSVLVTNLTIELQNIHCYLRIPLFNIGFMLSFGALFLKSYALHKVFNNPVLARIQARVDLLYAALCGLVALDATIIALWFGVSPFTLDEGVEQQGYVCPSEYTSSFNSLLMSSKGVFLLCGSYYTYKVRSIPSSFNESRFIGLVVFTSTLLGGVCMTLTLGLGPALNNADLISLENGVILLAAGVALVFLFGSKAVLMYQAKRESHIAAASTLNAAFGVGAARLSVASPSLTGRGPLNDASGVDMLPLSDPRALMRLKAHMVDDRTALLVLMQTTARYTNMLEDAKSKVEAQLHQIGRRVAEYRYHLAHNPAASEQANLLDVDEYISSLSPSFCVASNRVTLSMGITSDDNGGSSNNGGGGGGTQSKNGKKSDATIPSSPSMHPTRPGLSRAPSTNQSSAVSAAGSAAGGGGGGGRPSLTRAKSYTASGARVVNTGKPLPRTNSHTAGSLRRSHTLPGSQQQPGHTSAAAAAAAAAGGVAASSTGNSAASSPRTTQRRSHLPPPSSARSSHSHNGALAALPLHTLPEMASSAQSQSGSASSPPLRSEQVELELTTISSPKPDSNHVSGGVGGGGHTGPAMVPPQVASATPIPSATSTPMGSPYWRQDTAANSGISVPASPLLLAMPSSPSFGQVYVFDDVATPKDTEETTAAPTTATTATASTATTAPVTATPLAASVAPSRSHPRLSSLEGLSSSSTSAAAAVGPGLASPSGIVMPAASPVESDSSSRSSGVGGSGVGGSSSGSGSDGVHRRSMSNCDPSSPPGVAQVHSVGRSDSTPSSRTPSRRVSLLPFGYAGHVSLPPVGGTNGIANGRRTPDLSHAQAQQSTTTPSGYAPGPAHESAIVFSQRMQRSLRNLTATAAARNASLVAAATMGPGAPSSPSGPVRAMPLPMQCPRPSPSPSPNPTSPFSSAVTPGVFVSPMPSPSPSSPARMGMGAELAFAGATPSLLLRPHSTDSEATSSWTF